MLALFHILKDVSQTSCWREDLLGWVAKDVEASGYSTGSDLAVAPSLGPRVFHGRIMRWTCRKTLALHKASQDSWLFCTREHSQRVLLWRLNLIHHTVDQSGANQLCFLGKAITCVLTNIAHSPCFLAEPHGYQWGKWLRWDSKTYERMCYVSVSSVSILWACIWF